VRGEAVSVKKARAQALRLRKRWIAALLSGKFEQAVGALKNSFGFCCLGVYCQVVAPTKWRVTYAPLHPAAEFDTDFLSVQSYERLMITHDDGRALAKLNDASVPFDLIASVIEHLPYETD
jgi:hypothetical protein